MKNSTFKNWRFTTDMMVCDYILSEDHEHSMARSELKIIQSAINRLMQKLKGEGNIEAWVQSKITKAADYIDTAADYLDSGEVNNEEIVYEGDFWHPDPEIDRRLGGPGPNQRAREDYPKPKSPFNEMMEHCGCEDDAVKELETGLKKLNNTSYDSIDRLMRNIMKKHDMTAKQLHNAFVDKHNKTPDDWINEGTLHFWYHGSKSKKGKPGWVQPDGSPCANEPGETKTPKCFSSGRLRTLKRKGKKGLALIKSAVRRKREKDKGQQQKTGASAPTNVPTFAKGKKDKNYIKAEPGIKEAMELNEAQKDKPGKGSGKKDACYHKVKSRYSVWPSAYASGALVKCRKVGAANWGTKSESTDSLDGDWHTSIRERPDRYCPKCEKLEKRSECKYGSRYWDMFSLPAEIISSKKDYNITMPYPANEEINIGENYLRIQTRGSTYTILINWRGKYITTQMFFQQFTRPTKTEVTREIRKVYPNAIVLAFNPSANDPNKPLLFTGEPNGPKSY